MIGFVLVLFGFIYEDNQLFNGLIIIGLCILLGATVKTLDLIIDQIKSKSYKIWIIPLAIFIPSSMAYLALTEEPVIGMVIGAVIGMLIAGKIDHFSYVFSIIMFILLIIIAIFFKIITIETTTYYIIPVAAAGSFFDEFGHEKYSKNKKVVKFIFKHRFFLKIFAFLGVIVGFAQPIHLTGFICFDIFYDLIEMSYELDFFKNIPKNNNSKLKLNREVKNA